MKVTSINGNLPNQVLYEIDSVRAEGCFFVIRYWGLNPHGPEYLEAFFNDQGREVFEIEYPRTAPPKSLWQKFKEAISARAIT